MGRTAVIVDSDVIGKECVGEGVNAVRHIEVAAAHLSLV